ncbi:MptD family putative ECF transporter S component [Dictyobacter arantiisoli]|uniref:Uncharacterized protein n=1 Tax=Dictyobacter arantiisoli TaxID=2014874 RepID=A0A5A5T7I6_9CHLR|nr:MptD family putative ECF transporter S component [Dictyobacter arantiisoli]GCF07348.1 hypothetical protein KDI_09120 [Dictyobacter arantiisoli]
MFSQMLPWLIIACLVGVIAGLIIGTYVGSSLLQRHEKAAQPQPLTYPQGPTRYLDDDHYDRRPRR